MKFTIYDADLAVKITEIGQEKLKEILESLVQNGN